MGLSWFKEAFHSVCITDSLELANIPVGSVRESSIFSRILKFKMGGIWIFLACCMLFYSIEILADQVKPEQSFLNFNSDVKNDADYTAQLYGRMEICSGEDELSKRYCNCSGKVASCDFSEYPGSMKNKTELLVHIERIQYPVKRLCICGSPRHLRMNITKSPSTTNLSRLHRVDLDNLKGPLIVHDAFNFPFSGSFYMKHVNFLHYFKPNEFEKGADLRVENVEDLPCCSSIKESDSHAAPVLSLESSRIRRIYENGITESHLWKTVFLKNVEVQSIYAGGISLDMENSQQQQLNVSVINCTFNKAHKGGIYLKDFQNAVVAQNHFKNKSHAASFIANSTTEDSNLIVIDNIFDNGMIMTLNAHRVLTWFNFYDRWDNWTFQMSALQPFKNSVYSIEYNTVHEMVFNQNTTLQGESLLHSEGITFHENVIGGCKCSYVRNVFLPAPLKSDISRCDSHFSSENSARTSSAGNCFLDFQEVSRRCISDNSNIDHVSLCKIHGLKKPALSITDLEKVILKNSGLKILSSFVLDVVKQLHLRIHVHDIFHSEESGASNRPIKSSKGMQLMPLIVTLLSTFLLVALLAGIALLVRTRRIALSGGLLRSRLSASSYDVLTTST